MRAREFLIERIDISWIPGWIDNAVPDGIDDEIEWYQAFFRNLGKDQTFQRWKKANINNPLKIKAQLKDDPSNTRYVLGGDHEIYTDPNEHVIHVEVNVAPPLTTAQDINKFTTALSSVLTHELNHARQQDQRIDKDQDFYDISSKEELPEPTNRQEQNYQYVLDNLEIDAWLGQIAQELKSKLGDTAQSHLNTVFSSAPKTDNVVIDGRIIDISYLKNVYDALNYYEDYLKSSKEQMWNKVKKDLYKFL